MPNEYITKADAITALGVDADVLHHGETQSPRDKINTIPAAHVAEVVHGYWIQHDAGPLKSECSACRSTFNIRIEYDEFTTKLCPHCGAKMDGGEPHAD